MNPASPNWFYVYLLNSKVNNSIYIGCTSDLQKRLSEHNKGETYFTRRMLPVKLIYFEAYRSKKDAFKREKMLKCHGSASRCLKSRIKNTTYQGEAG